MRLLTGKEREFIEDWLKVQDGEMEKIEFFKKWGSKNVEFYLDLEKMKKGKMGYGEFSEKWMRKGEWKNRIRVMKSRLWKKRKKMNKILESIKEDIALIDRFFSLEEHP